MGLLVLRYFWQANFAGFEHYAGCGVRYFILFIFSTETDSAWSSVCFSFLFHEGRGEGGEFEFRRRRPPSILETSSSFLTLDDLTTIHLFRHFFLTFIIEKTLLRNPFLNASVFFLIHYELLREYFRPPYGWGYYYRHFSISLQLFTLFDSFAEASLNTWHYEGGLFKATRLTSTRHHILLIWITLTMMYKISVTGGVKSPLRVPLTTIPLFSYSHQMTWCIIISCVCVFLTSTRFSNTPDKY